VLVAAHAELVPPPAVPDRETKERADWRTEYDVVEALHELGHAVRVFGVDDDVDALARACRDYRPHVVFNLLVEFHGAARYDQHVVSFFELLRQPYTGCNPLGLSLARDKALSKTILARHGIRVPRFALFPRGPRNPRGPVRVPHGLPFPLFVKAQHEEASLGIAQASLVHDARELAERVAFLHRRLDADAIAEEFIEGRELTVGLLGHARPRVLPAWELCFEALPRGSVNVATRRAKWDLDYQKRVGLVARRARGLSGGLEAELGRTARAVHRALGLSGYARIDLRLRPDGALFVLEANPNPDLGREDDLAESAAAGGIPYPGLIQRVLELGLSYPAAWRA
jgi:D-alanine-D-alanine ligase